MADIRDSLQQPEGDMPPTSAEEIVARYAGGERYFEETDLPDHSDLRGSVLAGANFRRSWFFGADFTGADLRHVCFDICNVKCARLDGADLTGASFRDSGLESMTVVGAVLENVVVDGAACYGVPLHDIRQLLPADDPYHSFTR